ncbi:Beclin-1 [Bulinus truncatus]|nr:Beclin-1 [Bulinus truncatus]
MCGCGYGEISRGKGMRYWHEYNDQCRIAIELEDEQKSVDNQLKYAQAQLDRLKKTNVFNATFHIWHDGEFGTINDFRLGRLPGTVVEWTEINTAWGQVVLLLGSLANKIGLKFKKYRPVPYGNHSYIEVLDEKKELPLYGSGGIRFLWDTKFDSAMVAFLECLQQFRDEVEKEDSSFNLPYKMSKGKIYEGEKTQYSIKMQVQLRRAVDKGIKVHADQSKVGPGLAVGQKKSWRLTHALFVASSTHPLLTLCR